MIRRYILVWVILGAFLAPVAWHAGEILARMILDHRHALVIQREQQHNYDTRCTRHCAD